MCDHRKTWRQQSDKRRHRVNRQTLDLGTVWNADKRNVLSLAPEPKDSSLLTRTELSSYGINLKRPIRKRNDIQMTLVRKVGLKYQKISNLHPSDWGKYERAVLSVPGREAGKGCSPAGLVEIRIVTALFKSSLMTSIRLKITTPLTLRPHSWDSHGNQTPVL